MKTTINYQFSDGHFEEIEVTEEFKKEYEFMLVQEQALYWKIKKQKQRAGFPVKSDLSLDKLCEDGFEPASCAPDPLTKLIERESRRERLRSMLKVLTKKQKQVFILYYIKGCSKVKISEALGIAESSVRERLENARKNILRNF